MGRWYVEYYLPGPGRAEWVLFSAFIHYRLPDDARLPILQQLAWCPACDGFVVAEELPSIEALEQEIARLQSGDRETLRMWAFVSNGTPAAKRVAELRKRIAWRRERQAPPRCLDCGEVGATLIPGGGEFAHPGTGVRVVVASSGWADTARWFAEFSPEGEQVNRQQNS